MADSTFSIPLGKNVKSLITVGKGSHIALIYADNSCDIYSLQAFDSNPYFIPFVSQIFFLYLPDPLNNITIAILISQKLKHVEITTLLAEGHLWKPLTSDIESQIEILCSKLSSETLILEDCLIESFVSNGDIFINSNSDRNKLWMWKGLKGNESLRIRCLSCINISNPFSFLLTNNHIILGEIGQLHVYPIETLIRKTKDMRDFFITLPSSDSSKKSVVINLSFVTNECIIAMDSAGLMYAVNTTDIPKVVRLQIPFRRTFEFSIIIRSASRVDSSTLSGMMIVSPEKRSMYLLSFKEVFTALESSSFQEESVKLNVLRAILSKEDISVIATISPDCIFTADSHLTLYLLRE